MKERRREKGREKTKEEEEEEEEEERYETMVLYGIVIWMAMFLYGTCMEEFVWILVVPFLRFS